MKKLIIKNQKNLNNNFKRDELIKIFIKNFKLDKKTILKLKNNEIDLKFNDYDKWDSLKHASILTDLEIKFKIQIKSSNLIHMNSFNSILNFLRKIKK